MKTLFDRLRDDQQLKVARETEQSLQQKLARSRHLTEKEWAALRAIRRFLDWCAGA